MHTQSEGPATLSTLSSPLPFGGVLLDPRCLALAPSTMVSYSVSSSVLSSRSRLTSSAGSGKFYSTSTPPSFFIVAPFGLPTTWGTSGLPSPSRGCSITTLRSYTLTGGQSTTSTRLLSPLSFSAALLTARSFLASLPPHSLVLSPFPPLWYSSSCNNKVSRSIGAKT